MHKRVVSTDCDCAQRLVTVVGVAVTVGNSAVTERVAHAGKRSLDPAQT